MREFECLSTAQILAITIYGEARGEPTEGKIAVGSVILERAKRNKWYGKSVKDVCLKKWQFSCFNSNDPNLPKLINIAEQWDENMTRDYALNDCYSVASGLLDGRIEPNIKATHYHTLKASPYWKDDMKFVGIIGHHKFYDEVK